MLRRRHAVRRARGPPVAPGRPPQPRHRSSPAPRGERPANPAQSPPARHPDPDDPDDSAAQRRCTISRRRRAPRRCCRSPFRWTSCGGPCGRSSRPFRRCPAHREWQTRRRALPRRQVGASTTEWTRAPCTVPMHIARLRQPYFADSLSRKQGFQMISCSVFGSRPSGGRGSWPATRKHQLIGQRRLVRGLLCRVACAVDSLTGEVERSRSSSSRHRSRFGRLKIRVETRPMKNRPFRRRWRGSSAPSSIGWRRSTFSFSFSPRRRSDGRCATSAWNVGRRDMPPRCR